MIDPIAVGIFGSEVKKTMCTMWKWKQGYELEEEGANVMWRRLNT